MVAQTRKRKAAVERAAEKAPEASTAAAPPKRQKLPVRSKTDEPPAQETSGKGTLITFHDDDGLDGGVKLDPAVGASTTDAVATSLAEQETSDDDDAPPEAVSTAQAASDVKKSAQAAQEAARQKSAAEKRKRQERDALLKKQAEGRKRAEKEAGAAAPQPEDGGGDVAPSTTHRLAAGGRRRTDKVSIPTVLPVEFLTDSSSEDDEEGEGNERRLDSSKRPPKKRGVQAVEKRLSRQSKGPRDERRGSTVYRVAAERDERLAPKSRTESMNFRDALLRRKRTAVKPRPGFLIK
ncbi:hypothetical protein CDD83_7287 [Cordyceps sp. RAO-2017]|nr:hypothetical protein CDD83_7287 [Cordyceps sp. RAO-2017]